MRTENPCVPYMQYERQLRPQSKDHQWRHRQKTEIDRQQFSENDRN